MISIDIYPDDGRSDATACAESAQAASEMHDVLLTAIDLERQAGCPLDVLSDLAGFVGEPLGKYLEYGRGPKARQRPIAH